MSTVPTVAASVRHDDRRWRDVLNRTATQQGHYRHVTGVTREQLSDHDRIDPVSIRAAMPAAVAVVFNYFNKLSRTNKHVAGGWPRVARPTHCVVKIAMTRVI